MRCVRADGRHPATAVVACPDTVPILWRLLAGAAGAGLVAAAARRLRALDRAGAWSATAVGGAVFGLAGWAGAVPLLVFFATSSLLGRLPGRPPHGARDARQVWANGGWAALAALAWALTRAPAALAALVGALAAANADTWATELGTRLGGVPRRLLLGPRLPTGRSGGMTAAGTLAGAAGAGLVAAAALPAAGGVVGAAALAGGVAGLLADSVLGAMLQVRYRCPHCGSETEEPTCAACGRPGARPAGGVPGLDNDAVNAAATLVGVLLALGVAGGLGR